MASLRERLAYQAHVKFRIRVHVRAYGHVRVGKTVWAHLCRRPLAVGSMLGGRTTVWEMEEKWDFEEAHRAASVRNPCYDLCLLLLSSTGTNHSGRAERRSRRASNIEFGETSALDDRCRIVPRPSRSAGGAHLTEEPGA